MNRLTRVEARRGALHPPRGTGGPYEVYVVTSDGFYVAGGTRQYGNKRTAIGIANAWRDSRHDVRAYVVTL